MARLIFPLRSLVDLGDPERAHLALPWHDVDSDWDAVTNGQALLTWNGAQFTARPSGPDVPAPPSIAGFREPGAKLGQTRLKEVYDWAAPSGTERCEDCGDLLQLDCDGCGARGWLVLRPGLFCGVPINRALLARYMRPVWDGIWDGDRGGWLIDVSRQGADGPIQLSGDGWLVVIMPLNPKAPDTTPVGTPFELPAVQS